MDNNHQALDVEGERLDAAWLAERSALEAQPANLIQVSIPTRIWNPAVRACREDLERAAVEMRASRKASDRYDKWPESRKRVESSNASWKWQWGRDRGQRLVDTAKALAFRVSLETYERALRIMNALALAAEARGYCVRHDKDAGRLVFTGHDSEVQARIAELLERRHRPITRYDGKVEQESYMKPTGRLRVSLQVGYGEGPTFQDQGTRKLESQLNRVFLTTYRLTVKCWQRKRERQAYQGRSEEAQRQRAEADRVRVEHERQAAEERRRRERLFQEAEDWKSAEQIYAYVAHIRATADTTETSSVDAGWIEWALGVAEDLDPAALRLSIRSKTEG
jgi:hypothetical protein